MAKENDDPEKRNLLNEKKEDKKLRQYGSRNKLERRSGESSNSDHRKRGAPRRTSSTEQRTEFINKARSQSMQNTPVKKTEDTCSCGSCALKKIVSSEYACIGCLLLLFIVSIIVAFFVVFKHVPYIGGETKVLPRKECKGDTTSGAGPTTPKRKECKDSGVVDSERLKRKIEMLSNEQMKKGFIGLNEFRKNDNKGYDGVLSGHIDIPGVSGIDFGPSFRELNYVEQNNHKLARDLDLSNVLNLDKNIDLQSSEKLREFYKKLIQTDAQIKSLKSHQVDTPYVEDEVRQSPERSRRSLKLYHYPKSYHILRHRRSLFGKHQKVNETGTKTRFGNKTREKRFDNEGDEPTGLVIEKKKLLVQYKPVSKNRIPVKKCQHAPAGTHTHEKQMMHPFYKNTQKLDMLLDKFLNRNLPQIISDPFGLDDLFKHDKLFKQCKHPKPHKNVNIMDNEQLIDQIPKPTLKFNNFKDVKIGSSRRSDLYKILRPESTTQYEREFLNHEVKMIAQEKTKIVTTSPSHFEVLLSVSTIMNPNALKISKTPPVRYQAVKIPKINKAPNIRKLMQLEAGEDEENLGYEDFKEVLTDDMDNHDEMEKSGDRKRRENDPTEPSVVKYQKFNAPQNVHNPNWKGAMPLYPDEVNSMMTNKAALPKPTDEIQLLLQAKRKSRDLSDIEYVEDYLANKYNKLVQQAQAYSDYGVLDGKKESRNEKDLPTADTATNHKIKLSSDENFYKAGLLGRLKRGRVRRLVTDHDSNIWRAKDIFKNLFESNRNDGINDNHAISHKNPTSSSSSTNTRTPNEYASEGIRFELQPTSKSRDDLEKINIMKMVSKHLKLKSGMTKVPTKSTQLIYPQYIQSTLISAYPNLGIIYSTKPTAYTEMSTVVKTLEEIEKGLSFAMSSGKRRLLSTDFQTSSDFRNYKDTSGYSRGNTERNRISIERFVDSLHMNNESNDESALAKYIEKEKQMNIHIFSTPRSYDITGVVSESHNTIIEARTPIEDTVEIANVDDSVVKINQSIIKTHEYPVDSFFGKILLTVKNPEFGAQHFNLTFDIPLVINSEKELMMMSDNFNYPNVYNQFELYSNSTIAPHVTDLGIGDYDHSSNAFVLNRTTGKRLKREAHVTATWVENNETKVYTDKITNNVTEESDYSVNEATIASILANVSSDNMNSSVSAAHYVTLTILPNHSAAGFNSTSRTSPVNSSVAEADNMTLSDFLAVISNWFRTLEYGKEDKTRNRTGSVLTDLLLTVNSNSNNSSNETDSSTKDSFYPMYDSDMIENIGHRSRVLLSVESVRNVTEGHEVVNNTKVTKVTAASNKSRDHACNGTQSTTITIKIISNATTTKMDQHKHIQPTRKEVLKRNVKAIFKRNADDSNLIFWNDIYDDEYGIQTDRMDNYMKDKLDNAVRDKHSVKEKDFIKRSGRWVQSKIRKFAKNLKINPHSNEVPSVHSDNMVEIKERVPRSIENNNKKKGSVTYPQMYDRVDDHIHRRESDDKDEIEEDYPEVDQKSLFAALSVNMKEVCKKAAKAVQQTRNMNNLPDNLKRNDVENESQQGSIASAMMQQLVRLLTDLVEYQIQQKTCVKLPPDLKSFLEWLVYSKEETVDPEKQTELLLTPANENEEINEELHEVGKEEKSASPDDLRLGDKQEPADEKDGYIENLYSILDLLEEYENLSSDDKSKMTDVKDYLEQQLEFLKKQLSTYDIYTFFENNNDMLRKKRDVYIMRQYFTKKRRPQKKMYRHKFIRNYGKKHTKTTVGYDDGAQVTDMLMNGETIENEEVVHSALDKNLHQKLAKRNLKDVYYKAVAEAKKYSTVKMIHKKDEMSSFETSAVTTT